MKNAYIGFLFLLLSLSSRFTVPVTAQIPSIPYLKTQNVSPGRWQVVDISFRSRNASKGNPFLVSFGATFNGPGRRVIKIPGFYNGENEYVIRFSGSEVGRWEFVTYSSAPELAGKKGVVNVTPNTNAEKRGMVKIDEQTSNQFVYEDSSTYFSLAFELDWLFALDFHNKNDIPRTRQIVSDLKGNGFNQIVMNVYAYDVGWTTEMQLPERYEYRRPSFSPFRGTNEQPDFSSLNIEFFKHFDRVIDHLEKQDIVAHLMIYVWNKKVNWPAMYSEADNMYFDYVIARYQAFSNIIWDISKEALDYGRCDIPYINERISRIRSADAFGRLVTVHDYEYCSREPDRVDFISIQSWRSDLHALMLEARSKHSDKPVVNIEHGGYEAGPYISFKGNYTDARTCLIRNYECVFAGVYSTYYWQNTSWNIVVYDPLGNSEIEPAPRFDYYRNLAALFTRYDYNNLSPSSPKITTNSRIGLDNLSTSGYALSNGKDLYLYFLPPGTEYTNVIVPKLEQNKMTVTYFNIFTGEFTKPAETGWTGWKELRSPWPGEAYVAIVATR